MENKQKLRKSLTRLENLNRTEMDYRAALATLNDTQLAKVEKLDDIGRLSEYEAEELDDIMGDLYDFLSAGGQAQLRA
ncbi:hypothetical protein [Magnetofaba australis]|uniref:Uncharacterized protein n=1 Tax=Magnetofaba australis IT-1 TaxID=1434232 RepID=A0A1Y2K4H6_9PROT|nr:hypothetical protein [Magnetofaba australis]OSM02567.1 hypothetical protein MAIT1_02737 [Magnetofaba australis IT-1]